MRKAMRCPACDTGLTGYYDDGTEWVECPNDDCVDAHEAFTVAGMKSRIDNWEPSDAMLGWGDVEVPFARNH